jgi:hypothetical protein
MIVLDGTQGETFPSWTTATRPSSPTAGQMGYNSTYGGLEVYNGSAWDLITGGPAIQVYNNVAQSISTTTGTIIQANTKVFDTNGCYNNTSSSTTLNGLTAPAWSFTPNVPGYYQVNAQTIVANTSTGVNETYLYKNGGVLAFGASGPTDGGNMLSTVSMVIYCNGTGDYIQFGTYQSSGATKTLLTGNTGFNNMSIAYVRGA